MPTPPRRLRPALRAAVRRAVVTGVVATLAVLGCAAAAPPAGAAEPHRPRAAAATVTASVDTDTCATVGPVAPDVARCFAIEHERVVRNLATGAVTPAAASSAPVGGITPSQLRTAYGVGSATAPAGTTVAIVDAFDAPGVEADLATFRAQWGMPACTTANGCFRKLDQRGGVVPANKSTTSTAAPVYNAGWQLETTLDTQAVSAMCPTCRILLVEADSSLLTALGPALATAVGQGATIVSNSFGSLEAKGQLALDATYWNQPGVTIFAASGDYGWLNYDKASSDPAYGRAYFPATSPYVTAVGGTSLTLGPGGAIASETAWSDAGSGCSILEPRPGWQQSYFTAKGVDPDPYRSAEFPGCTVPGGGPSAPSRAEADVSALADPSAPGFPVYLQGVWKVAGGTSLAAPLLAGLQALAGPRGAGTSLSAVAYGLAAHGADGLADVTSGTNKPSSFGCGGQPICTAGTGWDGPSGLGAPRGTGLFQPLTSLSPAAVVPGATVTVTGRNFLAGEDVTLTVGGSAVSSPVQTSTDGTFTTTVTVPPTASGTFAVTSTGTTSGFTSTQTVAITAPAFTASSSTIVPLISLPVALAGFAANETVVITVSGGSPSSTRVGPNGSTTTTVSIPVTASGTVTVTGTGQTSGIVASTGALPVTPPSLTSASPTAHVGDTVSLAAAGFGSRENVLTDTGSAPTSAGSAGTFGVTWTVPAGALGLTTITVSGVQTGLTASALVDVLGDGPVPAAPTLLSTTPLAGGTSALVAVRTSPTGAAPTSVAVHPTGSTQVTRVTVGGAGDVFVTVPGLTPGAGYTFVAVAGDANGDSAPSGTSLAVTANDDVGTGDLTPVGPIRVYDSRADTRGALRPGETRSLTIGGLAGVPAQGVSAVVVSLTVVAPTASGFVTLYPAGPTRPGTSTANFVAGQFTSSLAKIELGTAGALSFYNLTGRTGVVLDVVGFYAAGDGTFAHNQSYAPVAPLRVLDTRTSGGRVASGTARTVRVRGGSSGIPSSATGVELGVQAVDSDGQGYLTVYPTGLAGGQPTVSNVQYAANRPVVTSVVATIGADGTVTVFANVTTDVIVDVLGYYSGDTGVANERFVPVTPTRYYDTRVAGGPVGQQQTRTIGLGGAAALDGSRPVPASATEAQFSLVGVGNTAPTFVTAYRAGVARPTVTSLLPQPAGLLFDNLVLSQLGSGQVSLFNNLGSIGLVVDVEGYYVPVGGLPPS